MKFLSKTLPMAVSAAMVLSSVPAFAAPNDTALEVNGQSVAFTDVTPYETDGVLYLPYAAMMEAEGYTAVQTDEGIVATKDGKKIVFQIGGQSVAITEDGETFSIPMAPAVIADDRTFITVSAAEDILGLASTVTEEKVSLETPTYELMDKLSAYSADLNTNIQAEGTLHVDINFPDLLELSTKSDIKSVTTDAATSFEMLTKSKYVGGDESVGEVMKQLENIKYILDLDTNKIYFLFGPSDAEETWYVMDLQELFDSLGMDADALKGLMNPGAMDFSAYMEKTATELFAGNPEAVYAMEKTMRDLYSDQKFHRTSEGYQADYSMEEEGVSLDVSFFIPTNGQDQATGYAIAMTSKMDDEVLFSINVTMDEAMNMKMSGNVAGFASMQAELQYSKLESAPEIKIPENATPFSISDLL